MPRISVMLHGVAPRTRDLTNPALIAQAVSARREYLSLTQEDLGVGRSTVSLLESGERGRYQSAKLATVGRRLGWPVDWIERVEAGEDLTSFSNEPVEVKPGANGARQSDFEVLAVRVARLQREVAALVAVSEDRVAKFDALLADTLPDLLARVRRLEDPGDSQASSVAP